LERKECEPSKLNVGVLSTTLPLLPIELKERLTKDPMTPSITINNLALIIAILGDFRLSFINVMPSVFIPNVVMPSAFVMSVVAHDLD
jgi:hypothetical protein